MTFCNVEWENFHLILTIIIFG